MTNTRQDNDVFPGLSSRLPYMMKTRQDNDVTDCIGAIYAKKET